MTGFSANFQFQDETYYLSEDTQFYQDGVMFCVYDDNGKLLYGTMPDKFPKQTILKSHTPRVITSGSQQMDGYMTVCIPMERIRLYGSEGLHPFMRSKYL